LIRSRRAALAMPAFRAALRSAAEDTSGLPRMQAVEWLVSRGERGAAWTGGWREWLLGHTATGALALRRWPAGAAVRALAAGRRVDGCWACAEPVHLLTALDHLRLAPRSSLDLTAEERQALVPALNQALVGSGCTLYGAEPHPWTLACDSNVECESVEPALAEGHDIREWLPGGRDGARVRRLMNELQMWLHEHPVNAVWLWGFGTAEEVPAANLPLLHADDAWLMGLWRLQGAECGSLADAGHALQGAAAGDMLVAAAAASDDPLASLRDWESLLCEPLAAAVREGRIGEGTVLFGDAPVSITHRSRFAVWRRPRPLTDFLA
jgi:hypothetical protein